MMEKINFNYSLKNIPIPSPSTYKMKLIEKVGSVIKRMRWKAHFYLSGEKEENDDGNIDTKKENYGFESRKCPQQCSELENFEEDLLEIVKNI